MPVFLDVDPRTLHLPSSRTGGADPAKLARQFSRHGLSVQGMPSPWVVRDGNGRLQLVDGVTRATRVAKCLPGQTIRVEVIADQPNEDFRRFPTVGDRLP
jgi:hypothetical protein